MANLGIVYRDMGEWELAIEYLKAGLNIQRAIGDRQAESNQLGNLGTVYQRTGNYEQAADCHQQALIVSRAIGELDAQRRHLGNLGIVYAEGLKDDAQAYASLAEAIDLTERLRGGLVEGALRMGYFRQRLYMYRAMVKVCLRLGHRAEAWQFTERSRSRVFLDALSHTGVAPPAAVGSEHLARVTRLAMAIRSHEVALTRLKDDSERNRLARQIAQMQAELKKALDRFEAVAPEYVALRLGRPANWKEMRVLLQPSVVE
jgi:tetratricopeptide (TPR) repeat protein